jgi:transcriptional regulator
MREFSVIKQNILQFIERQDISKYELYKKTGISNGTLSQKGGMSEENIIKFLSVYREVSAEWLLTGKGEMLKSSVQNIVQNSGKNSINNISGNIEQQNYNELMEIIREKDRQIAKKDEQINKLIEKLIN